MHIIFAFDIFVFDIFITQIQFYTIPKNPQMCPAHRDLPTPPTLTLGSTFRIQYHHIPITASRLFHSQHPFRPFSSIGSAFRPHHRRIHITASRLFHSQQPFRPFSSIGSAFRPHHRRIHITASNLFSLSTTLQAVLLHRLSLPSPSPSHTYNGLKSFFTLNNPSGRSPSSAQPSVPNTVAYRHKSTKLPPSTTKHS